MKKRKKVKESGGETLMKNTQTGEIASVGSDSASKSLANKMKYTQKVPGNVTPLGKF